MTVKIALCDDETAELNKTERLLSAYEQKHTSIDLMIECFESADELLYMVRERKYSPDLIFMDIYMPGETGESVPLGMEAARRLRDMGSRARLVFLTTSREHALDAFDVEASQYLLKPIQTDKLFSLLDRFRKEAEEEREKYILLRVEGMLKKVPLNDIVYCEAQGKRQCIYMADGTEVLQNLTMAKIYEMCSACQELVKVGASYIIHLEHIDSLNAQEVWMDNGQKIYLPRGTYRLLREQYFDYYCGKE
ncbi:MAG: LytTR family DNA-binding domain-containing protein [Lachnospiraceae bacterium]|nr:LytTR family DNA-binding domain-containing protein [Lachnospiraceae bacterium]